MDKAEASTTNRGFARSARLRVFNRAMGIEETKGAFRSPGATAKPAEGPSEVDLGANFLG